jgi:hypothetical protein
MKAGVCGIRVWGIRPRNKEQHFALDILLAGFTIIFLIVCATLLPYSLYSVNVAAGKGTPITITVLVALLVCLIPTTIGGLLSAIGIAGMDWRIGALRLARRILEGRDVFLPFCIEGRRFEPVRIVAQTRPAGDLCFVQGDILAPPLEAESFSTVVALSLLREQGMQMSKHNTTRVFLTLDPPFVATQTAGATGSRPPVSSGQAEPRAPGAALTRRTGCRAARC